MSQPSSLAHHLMALGDGGTGKSAFVTQLCTNQILPRGARSYYERKTVVVEGRPTNLVIRDPMHVSLLGRCHEAFDLSIIDSEGFFLIYDTCSRTSFDGVVEWYRHVCGLKKDALLKKFYRKRPPFEKSSSKFTCFPKLPRELQLAVLRACLSSVETTASFNPLCTEINLNLLFTCKMFYEEGRKMLMQHRTFFNLVPAVLIGTKRDLVSRRRVSAKEGADLAKRIGCSYYEVNNKVHDEVEEAITELVKQVVGRKNQSIDLPDPTILKTHRRTKLILNRVFKRSSKLP